MPSRLLSPSKQTAASSSSAVNQSPKRSPSKKRVQPTLGSFFTVKPVIPKPQAQAHRNGIEKKSYSVSDSTNGKKRDSDRAVSRQSPGERTDSEGSAKFGETDVGPSKKSKESVEPAVRRTSRVVDLVEENEDSQMTVDKEFDMGRFARTSVMEDQEEATRLTSENSLMPPSAKESPHSPHSPRPHSPPSISITHVDPLLSVEEPTLMFTPSSQSPPPPGSLPRSPNPAHNNPIHDQLLNQYTPRLEELSQRALHMTSETLTPLPFPTIEKKEQTAFPDLLIPNLAVLIQGSGLPLSSLTQFTQNHLPPFLASESISAKIKLLAIRTPHLSTPPRSTDRFEDTNNHLWRWELLSLELLSSDCQKEVKAHRAKCRKISGHYKAIKRLLGAISTDEDAKISMEEEKVLKYEREEERLRLKQEKFKRQELSKEQVKEQTELRKKEKEDERKKLMKEKEEEKRIKTEQKEKGKLRKSEEKKLKEEKKEEDRKKQIREKETVKQKRKERMMMFFNTDPSSVHTPKRSSPKNNSTKEWDAESFRSLINSRSDFGGDQPPLSASAHNSRNTKTHYVTILPPSENNTIIDLTSSSSKLRNKLIFISFHTSHRPPYNGTFSKRSTLKPRSPFSRLPKIDYSYDSEDEWEEEEPGESCDSDDDEEEELGDKLDYQDGWLKEDEDFSDVDEDTKEIRRKIRRDGFVEVCIVGPGIVEGIGERSPQMLLDDFPSRVLCSDDICIDPYPPEARIVEPPPSAEKPKITETLEGPNLVTFFYFFHQSSVSSKEKLMDDFIAQYPSIASSRAQTARTLIKFANKRKIKKGEVVWEVPREVLEKLGLGKLWIPPAPKTPEVTEKNKVDKVCTEKLKTKLDKVSTEKKKTKVEKVNTEKKRALPVTAASANLFAAYLKKRKVE